MSNKINQIKKSIFPCKENNYRPLVLNGRFLSYLALILLVLKFISIFHLVFIPKSTYFADITSGLLVKMTNEERSTTGVSPLKVSSQLTQAAEMKAKDMIANNYFSHWSPDGKSPWYWIERAGYDYEYAGENLAMGFLDTKQVHNGWINSPSHRSNIINPNYSEIGIAVIGDKKERNTFFVVQMFATPRKDSTYAKAVEEIEETKETKDEDLKLPETEEEEPVFALNETETGENKEEIEEEVEEKIEEETEEDEKFILGDFDSDIRIYPAGTLEIDQSSYNVFKFLLLEYDALIQKIITIVLLFLGFILIINVFVRFDVQHPDLIFKGIFFLALFILFDYFDQTTIIEIFFKTPIIQ